MQWLKEGKDWTFRGLSSFFISINYTVPEVQDIAHGFVMVDDFNVFDRK